MLLISVRKDLMKYREKQDKGKVSTVFVFSKMLLPCIFSVQYLDLNPHCFLYLSSFSVFRIILHNKNLKQ